MWEGIPGLGERVSEGLRGQSRYFMNFSLFRRRFPCLLPIHQAAFVLDTTLGRMYWSSIVRPPTTLVSAALTCGSSRAGACVLRQRPKSWHAGTPPSALLPLFVSRQGSIFGSLQCTEIRQKPLPSIRLNMRRSGSSTRQRT